MERELSDGEALGMFVLCAGVVAGALWVMKATSEKARDKKLTWTEFLFPF